MGVVVDVVVVVDTYRVDGGTGGGGAASERVTMIKRSVDERGRGGGYERVEASLSPVLCTLEPGRPVRNVGVTEIPEQGSSGRSEVEVP